MRAWDSVTQGDSLRPGPAALTILLIGLLLSLAPVSHRLETTYYDFLATARDRAGSSEVVIVDTHDLATDGRSAWEASAFPELLQALRQAGARLVVAAEPPPLGVALPDAAQLATLATIEERRGAAGHSGNASTFATQLAALRTRSELHQRTIAAIAGMRNLVVAVPTFDGSRASADTGICSKQVLASGTGEDPGVHADMRRVRAIAAPPDSLCAAVLAAGHNGFWPDDDGVVRRVDLLVDAAGKTVPAAALRAVMALSYPDTQSLTVTAGSISWDNRRIRTTDGPHGLLRFYPGERPAAAFTTVRARDLLADPAAAPRVSGRIVVLGPAEVRDGEPGYVSPLGDHTSTTELTATAISNLLQQNFVVRPAWLAWAETGLLIAMGVAALLWGTRLVPALALTSGLGAAVALLGAEAWLVIGAGIWAELATPAAFVILALAATWFVQAQRPALPALQPALAGAAPSAPVGGSVRPEDELDLAFSMLRHQPPSEQVKQRLYDLAVEHARQRDLAKAERVLRHLAGVDPDFRSAGDKLQKLAGLRRGATPEPAPRRQAPPVVTPMPQVEGLAGQTIGRYQIEQPIGRGAMATVYLGRDPKINRRVAIKTIALAEEFTDSDLVNARTQFLREAESAGRLNHPNIISIYDAGEDGAVAYLAMEYFPGKPLSHYAQHGQLLPPAQALELMARAAEALHYAHAQHVVHRDVKPANLMYDIDTDTLKITDFGIARLTDSSRTKTGIILGTPSYMSPEQLAGTTVSGQSDLFSLGITLYQLLAGAPPFRADSIPQLMQKIAHERHPPIRALRPDLPVCVDELLDRALAKDPTDRFESGRAMALALRDCCSSLESSPAVVAR